MNEQKVTKVATSEVTPQEFLDSLKNSGGQMDILNEALGNEVEPRQASSVEPEAAPPVAPTKNEEVVAPPQENVAPKKDVTADKLADALGVAKEVTAPVVEKDGLDYNKLAVRNAELERTVAINNETDALKDILLGMPEDEASIVIAEVEKLIVSPTYAKLGNMTPKEKAGKLVAEARGLAIDSILAARDARSKANAEAQQTLTKIISGPDASPTGGSNGSNRINDLRRAAALGDSDAQEEFIYESAPGAKDFVDKILKNLG